MGRGDRSIMFDDSAHVGTDLRMEPPALNGRSAAERVTAPTSRVARYTVELPNDSTAPRRARHIVSEQLDASGHGGVVADAELLASELASNVVRHTSCEHFRLQIEVTDEAVRVSVADGDAHTIPVLQSADSERVGGRGLQVIESIADAWGYDVSGDEKLVWFEL